MEQEPLERDLYLTERRTLMQVECEGAHAYDKAILTLAAGALGLSLAFIREIAPLYQPATGWWLYLAWTALIASLLATLTSYQLSQVAHRRQRKLLDAQYLGRAGPNQARVTKLAGYVNLLNWSSLGAFVVGAASLAVFAGTNL